MSNDSRIVIFGGAGLPALMLLALGGCSQPASTGADQVPTGPDQVSTGTGQVTGSSDAAQACAAGGEQLLHVPSPDWRDQVIYMLLLDRFDDGDPTNNDQGYGEYDPNNSGLFNGGDIQGLINRIGYLKSLGITAVWIAPPVANQWWSSQYSGAGNHGYWAVNFKEVDAHFGTLDDYRRLSHELHCNGMYLIQDIVANHTANFFNYDGEYDPNDTAQNFYLMEPDSFQPAPTQPPFHMIDRLNPEHVAADIYHWTPTIRDFSDHYQETYYQLGHLADLNTENPVVIDALKDSYRYWIEEVGVDGFRVDTAAHVPHEFWRRFLHDEDGIYPHARRLGKDHFLTFGEAFSGSPAYGDSGETKITGYLGSEADPVFNSMLGFPMNSEIGRVFARGHPTHQMTYRLEQLMERFRDPFVIPNFIDNHDMARFLATATPDAFEQALAFLFTAPGIPIVYQGTEQGQTGGRAPMFLGGDGDGQGQFDTESEYYATIADLAGLRTTHAALTRGSVDVLASDAAYPGIFAFRRQHLDEVILVLMNTASHAVLAHGIDAGLAPSERLDMLFARNFGDEVAGSPDGRVSLVLPPRATLVLRPSGSEAAAGAAEAPSVEITVEGRPDAVQSSDFQLTGTVSRPNAPLQLVANGNLERTTAFAADSDGRWEVTVPVRDLGEITHRLQVLATEDNAVSEEVTYTAVITDAEHAAERTDPGDDAHGPTGTYVSPLQPQSRQQREIESAEVRAAGSNLELTLTMQEISDNWLPPSGFDNVSFSVFFHLPGREGLTVLPRINAEMPGGLTWNLAHIGTGWGSISYGTEGAGPERFGQILAVSPKVATDQAARTVTFFYEGALFGVDDWAGARIYITTWDGAYSRLAPEPSDWAFGGAEPDAPKIMDDILLEFGGAD